MRALARFDADAAETVLRAELAAPGTPDAARTYLDTLLSRSLRPHYVQLRLTSPAPMKSTRPW